MSDLDGRIAGYLELLHRYHRTLDLLSDQALDQVGRLVADAKAYAAAVARQVPSGGTVVDVGSGAGLPGIVMAQALPDTRFVLVERRRRRAAFLELVAGRLSLDNVTVVNRDVRRLSGVCADAVTAQAVASLAEVARLTRHLQADPCLLISRRGPGWELEIPVLSSAAVTGQAVTVVEAEPLEQRGSLVTLRLSGGPACRSSA